MKRWFQRSFVFSYGSTKSCGAVIYFFGLQPLDTIDKKSNENGQILIVDDKINGENLLFASLCNVNTESEQIKKFHTLKNLFEVIDNI